MLLSISVIRIGCDGRHAINGARIKMLSSVFLLRVIIPCFLANPFGDVWMRINISATITILVVALCPLSIVSW